MQNQARQTRSPVRSRLNRRVLIVTDDVDRSFQLVEHLRELSLDVSLMGYDGATEIEWPDRSPSAVLCFLSDFVEHGAKIVAEIRSRYAPREFPILGRLMRATEGDHPFDSVLYEPVHAVQVAHRVSSMIRLGQMEAEIIRRMETLRVSFDKDITLPDAQLRQPFRVLFIGKADPAYMAVVNALQDKNVNVVAAFTSFSAFDYLHDSTFDAVVMNALKGGEPALTIAETMRRNPHLFHVPTLLLVDKATFRDADAAFDVGIKDLINADAPPEELSGRILELANECRLHQQLKDEFTNLGGEDCSDSETGVLNARFLQAHLKRVSRDCRARKVPLSIMTLKLTPKFTTALTGGTLKLAYAQSIKMIAGVVRMQDIVARIDKDKLVVAFPEERRSDVARVAARINDMIDRATFADSEGNPSSLRMKIETAIVEQSEETGQTVDERSSDHLELIE
jgi:two-component system cell cycle response regulator PopA